MTERIAILIPALDAASSVGNVVEESLRYMPDVIVVNDGSTDRTSEVAREAGAVVLDHPKNLGKGGALKTGFRYALEHGFDAVISIDADGQHLPAEIPRFVAAWKETGADLIIGSRSHLFAQMLARRRMANQFSAAAISTASSLPISDSQSGFRLYSARLLKNVTINADGFDAESEVIVLAGKCGLRVVQIPIELGFVNGITTSHYRPVADTVKIAWTVFRTWLTH
ncbi:MAG: glycosyltransferase family 2 protein [Thermoanaerobaculia bacterium]